MDAGLLWAVGLISLALTYGYVFRNQTTVKTGAYALRIGPAFSLGLLYLWAWVNVRFFPVATVTGSNELLWNPAEPLATFLVVTSWVIIGLMLVALTIRTWTTVRHPKKPGWFSDYAFDVTPGIASFVVGATYLSLGAKDRWSLFFLTVTFFAGWFPFEALARRYLEVRRGRKSHK